jgi:hypothetical protein
MVRSRRRPGNATDCRIRPKKLRPCPVFSGEIQEYIDTFHSNDNNSHFDSGCDGRRVNGPHRSGELFCLIVLKGNWSVVSGFVFDAMGCRR